MKILRHHWWLLAAFFIVAPGHARTFEARPAVVDREEEFEILANQLQPGDELILHGGTYSQSGRRAVHVKGTREQPILIRAAAGETPILTRPAPDRDRQNNIEFVDCEHLLVRGLRFQGGSSGVRFIGGRFVTFEECEILETGNNALTMNSGDCHAFVIRRNHIHHTGLSTAHPTEGEGMYIGCHNGSCRTTDSLIEGNYIHHLRGTSDGGNDGIEIKFGSYGNVVRDNVIHDTNIERQYPGIFVYGGGAGTNLVEGNVVWNAGEGIQVVSDAIVRNNIIFHCSATGITAAPHAAVRHLRNTIIVNNTIFNAPVGVRIRWSNATNMVFANNAIYCSGGTALDAGGFSSARLRQNYVQGRLTGIALDNDRVCDGGVPASAFVDPQQLDFRPGPSSPLQGRAEPAWAPDRDFDGLQRHPPFNVGAYEPDERPQHPGWRIQPGFKK
ncbi:MAG TPA: right-handed parallel beta-helix repeat-containing protein [Verrucomicrobiae bacterium]|nr:right-handed parallel beta-helix repeat-containing protein [Verrucomicrobiae bacterium]